MCGIWAYIQLQKEKGIPFTQCFDDFYKVKHRGPTNSYFETYENVCVGFHCRRHWHDGGTDRCLQRAAQHDVRAPQEIGEPFRQRRSGPRACLWLHHATL